MSRTRVRVSYKKFQSRFAYCFVTHCQISFLQVFLHSFNLPKYKVVGLLMVEWLFGLLFLVGSRFFHYMGGSRGSYYEVRTK